VADLRVRCVSSVAELRVPCVGGVAELSVRAWVRDELRVTAGEVRAAG